MWPNSKASFFVLWEVKQSVWISHRNVFIVCSASCLSFEIGRGRLYYWTAVRVWANDVSLWWISLMHTLWWAIPCRGFFKKLTGWLWVTCWQRKEKIGVQKWLQTAALQPLSALSCVSFDRAETDDGISSPFKDSIMMETTKKMEDKLECLWQ